MNYIETMNYHRDKDYFASEKQFRNIFQKRSNLLKVHLGGVPGRTHRVLEVGCSNGVFLDLLKEQKWQTWGVESSGSALMARQKGHKVIKERFEKVKLTESYFDLIVMNHVLEHLDNPQMVLRKARGLLKPGGLIFIDVPNAGSLSSKILGKRWPYLLPKEHKHQFTKINLGNLLAKSGLKVIYWESRSGIFEYAHPLLELWQALTGLKRRFFTDILIFPYALIATVLNRGDSMSFLAEKK